MGHLPEASSTPAAGRKGLCCVGAQAHLRDLRGGQRGQCMPTRSLLSLFPPPRPHFPPPRVAYGRIQVDAGGAGAGAQVDLFVQVPLFL